MQQFDLGVKSDSMSQIYKAWMKKTRGYFEPEELLSKSGMDLFRKGLMVIDWDFLGELVAFREKMDVPFIVNSGDHHRRGWRSSAENLIPPCTGKPYHPMGVAADITPKGMDILEFAAEAQYFGFHGVGVYNTFVHVDLRPRIGDRTFTWDNR